MKKRHKKNLVIKAIIALNNDVAKDLGIAEISRQDAVNVYKEIKDSKSAINDTLRDYRTYILKSN